MAWLRASRGPGAVLQRAKRRPGGVARSDFGGPGGFWVAQGDPPRTFLGQARRRQKKEFLFECVGSDLSGGKWAKDLQSSRTRVATETAQGMRVTPAAWKFAQRQRLFTVDVFLEFFKQLLVGKAQCFMLRDEFFRTWDRRNPLHHGIIHLPTGAQWILSVHSG